MLQNEIERQGSVTYKKVSNIQSSSDTPFLFIELSVININLVFYKTKEIEV